jgi:DNA-binding CsgD family transcriptional regulator
LRGRQAECRALDLLLEDVRGGQSRVLVLRGEAGSGKTALLEHASRAASGCRVARATGVEAEMELAFAGLHQLCAPMLGRLESLPLPQRDAIGTAFGLSAGSRPEPFLIGLAALGLLSESASHAPLVCLVDDAHWLDRASAQALGFVARRLLAESVALVFVVREPSDDRAFAGLPELRVGGLRDDDARAVLDSAIRGRMDARVRDRILAEARGNPLALLELPRGLTPAQLAGGFGLPDAMPLVSRIEQSFVQRLRSLPFETQRLLLTAAVEPVGDPALVWRATERLGIAPTAAEPAETEGLIEFGSRIRFLHPLVRSAASRLARPGDLRSVHQALADAIDPKADPDRRAWHRAHAADAPDENVAAELERAAERVQERGGVAATAAFLERATELTPDPARRGVRALAAAHAKLQAGAPDAALTLLTTAETEAVDDLQRARVEVLRARIAFASNRGNDAAPLLLEAARRLERLDPELARETYLEALGAAIFAGRLGSGVSVREAAEAARAAPAPARPVRAADVLLDGLTTRFTDGYAAGAPKLEQALEAFSREAAHRADGARWLWLACPVAPEPIASEVWNDETWHRLATRAVELARDAGALAVLPIALSYRAGVHVHAGEFASAAALIDEADAIAAATGHVPLRYVSLLLLAWRGRQAEALPSIERDIQDATARGEGRAVGLAEYAKAVLHNGLGQYDAALQAAARACDDDDLGFLGWALVELVEAAARSGADEIAAEALRRLEERTRAGATDWALGIGARSGALLRHGPAAEALYREAIERLARSRITVHRARAHLIYGEWLRREKRRRDARTQLHAAYDLFARMGAEAFMARARSELLATGETMRARTVETRDELTAQERQIARLARDGHTNPEIGAQLFLSPRTVEYHLGKVFPKLGISSRRELRGAFRESEASMALV